MFVVGLTGGIGSGKSTVAAMLARRGAVVIDADVLSREVVEPGTDGYGEVVESFGPQVLAPDGTIDRPALAKVVFADPEKRARLEEIVHPRVGVLIVERLTGLRESDAVVVLDVPLLVETRSATARLANAIVVVAASPDTQIDRLARKGLAPDDARARMGAQAPLSEKLGVADYVIHNDGTLEELEKQVDELWQTLQRRARE